MARALVACTLALECLDGRPRNTLYIGQSKVEAERLIWAQVIEWLQTHRIPYRARESKKLIRLPHGSILRLRGCETRRDVDRMRGDPYDLVVIDEPASIRPALLELAIEDVINPALHDRRGRLLLIGTPGEALAGLFYEVTGPRSSEVRLDEDGVRRCRARPYRRREAAEFVGVAAAWSLHSWTKAENTAAPHIWTEALADKERFGWSDLNPTWRREYLGEWATDETRRVFRYDAARDDWTPTRPAQMVTPADRFGLPPGPWEYVIGVDLGTRDPFALEIVASSPTSREIYVVADEAEAGLTWQQWAERILEAVERCGGLKNVAAIVGDFDALGDALREQLVRDYGLPVQKARKRDKLDHVEIANGLLVDGRLKIPRGSGLSRELAELAYDETGLKTPSHQPNHRTDALVYVVTYLHGRGETPAARSEVSADEPVATRRAREAMARREAREAEHRRAQELAEMFSVGDWSVTEW